MRHLLPIAVISGCAAQLPEPESGSVIVCLGGPEVVTREDGGFDLDIEGEVISRGASSFNLAPCSGPAGNGIQIEDENGDIWSLGLGILDEDQSWVENPSLAFLGRQVSLTYRYRHPWGDVSGFVLSDVDGLIAAADEGSWGGALSDDDVPGLIVYPGVEVLAEKETSCAPILGFDMHFEADTEVVVPPVGTASITLNGRAYQAHAMDAHEDDVAPDGCSFADTPGIYAWAVTR